KGDAHHHGKLDAEPWRGAEGLQNRDNAANEQVSRYQEGDILWRQLQCTADDERHGDGPCIHDQHMLKAKREKTRGRQHLVDGMRDRRHDYFPLLLGRISRMLTRTGSLPPTDGAGSSAITPSTIKNILK